MDIGDWLYFAIIVVGGLSSIASFFRNQQQKKAPTATAQTQQRRTHPDPQPRSVQQTFGGKAGKNAPRKPSFPTTAANVAKGGRGIESGNEGISALAKDKTAFLYQADSQDEKATFSMEDMPSDIDEWRKAFIFKEIFQRKY